MNNIPLSRPWITDEDREAVAAVLRTDHLSLGPKLPAFEEDFRRFVGRKHAVAVSSGTAGLHLCVRALDIKDGDEVITTPFSFVASANCMLFERARPVFVDIEDRSLGMDPAAIEAAITQRTRAILFVHVFGHPCDVESIRKIAARRGLAMIEDACEAIGSECRGVKTGNFGDLAVFAFYPNKQMTCGEGGMVLTDDDALAARIRSMRNQGRSPNNSWLDHEDIGFNYRLDEMSCALGISQLGRIDEIIRKRAEVAGYYSSLLKGIPGIRPPKVEANVKMSWFVYVIRVEARMRDRLLSGLKDRGITAKPYFPAIHLQPAYRRLFGYGEGDFPRAEEAGSCSVALPFHTLLNRETVEKICVAVQQIMEKCCE